MLDSMCFVDFDADLLFLSSNSILDSMCFVDYDADILFLRSNSMLDTMVKFLAPRQCKVP